MKKLLSKLSVDGYNPFNGFNIFLSIVSGVGLGVVFYFVIGEGVPLTAFYNYTADSKYFLIAGLVSFLLLLFRNRKLKSIPKMLIISVISSILGVIVGIIAIILFILIVISGDSISDKIKIPNGTDSNDNKFKKQYSNTKGEYSTDGQGNFKDQYGNDVYNPQGVSDYDKL